MGKLMVKGLLSSNTLVNKTIGIRNLMMKGQQSRKRGNNTKFTKEPSLMINRMELVSAFILDTNIQFSQVSHI